MYSAGGERRSNGQLTIEFEISGTCFGPTCVEAAAASTMVNSGDGRINSDALSNSIETNDGIFFGMFDIPFVTAAVDADADRGSVQDDIDAVLQCICPSSIHNNDVDDGTSTMTVIVERGPTETEFLEELQRQLIMSDGQIL